MYPGTDCDGCLDLGSPKPKLKTYVDAAMVLQKRYGVSAILLSTESQDVIDELVSIRPGMRACLCWRCKCYKYGFAGVMLYAVELRWSYAGVVLELCWSYAAVMLRIAL
jgi:hypothetical protein